MRACKPNCATAHDCVTLYLIRRLKNGGITLAMTMRYAHLSPDHLKDAIRLNPLHSWQKIGNDGKNATPENKKP